MSVPASVFLKKLATLRSQELTSIHGIGEKIAQNLIEFTDSDRYQELLAKLEAQEAKTQNHLRLLTPVKNNAAQTLRGKTIVLTGSFDLPRPQIKTKLEALGAKVSGTVTQNTTLVIAGEKAGTKLAKAQNLNIPVLTDYKDLLKTPD